METVGRYRVHGELGAGGMGRVYVGSAPDGRIVAVKLMSRELAGDDGFRQRFRQEVAACRRVQSTYTARIVDADADAELPWLVSEFVYGPSLREAVRASGAFAATTVLRLAAGLAAALVDIHAAGLVHRDLKPGNVLLSGDGPRVIDFGIARSVDAEHLTRTGLVIGTGGYMSPEQAQAQPVGPASDVFSLGALLLMASTGADPSYNVVHAEPDLTGVPDPVRHIVERCLVRDPARRPTAAEVLELVGPVGPSTRHWPAPVEELLAHQRAALEQLLTGTADAPTIPRPRYAPGAAPVAGPPVDPPAPAPGDPGRGPRGTRVDGGDRARRERLVLRAERIAREIPDPDHRALALAHVAAALLTVDRYRAVPMAEEAEQTAREGASGPRWTAYALAEVGAALAVVDPVRSRVLLADAVRLARGLDGDSRRAAALRDVAVALAAVDPDRAERVARAVAPDRPERAEALGDVAVALATVDPDHAERVARDVTDRARRAYALARVAVAVAAADQERARRLAGYAEHGARGLSDPLRPVVLAWVAAALAGPVPARAGELAAEAMSAAGSVTDPELRAQALARVAAALRRVGTTWVSRAVDLVLRIAHGGTDDTSGLVAYALAQLAATVADHDPARSEALSAAAERCARTPGHRGAASRRARAAAAIADLAAPPVRPVLSRWRTGRRVASAATRTTAAYATRVARATGRAYRGLERQGRLLAAVRDTALVVLGVVVGAFVLRLVVADGVPTPFALREVAYGGLAGFPFLARLLSEPLVFLTLACVTLGGATALVLRVVGGVRSRNAIRTVLVGYPVVGAVVGLAVGRGAVPVRALVLEDLPRLTPTHLAQVSAVVLGVVLAVGVFGVFLGKVTGGRFLYLVGWALVTMPVLMVAGHAGWAGLSVDGVRVDVALVSGAAIGAAAGVRVVTALRHRR